MFLEKINFILNNLQNKIADENMLDFILMDKIKSIENSSIPESISDWCDVFTWQKLILASKFPQ